MRNDVIDCLIIKMNNKDSSGIFFDGIWKMMYNNEIIDITEEYNYIERELVKAVDGFCGIHYENY